MQLYCARYGFAHCIRKAGYRHCERNEAIKAPCIRRIISFFAGEGRNDDEKQCAKLPRAKHKRHTALQFRLPAKARLPFRILRAP
ncbi:MAG: hypothetical protein LBU37_06380 [Tannerellaceae bacterium]|nr:hypothetical protein [Tannerellaceae bacterium]